jgi:hypothetical protein
VNILQVARYSRPRREPRPDTQKTRTRERPGP